MKKRTTKTRNKKNTPIGRRRPGTSEKVPAKHASRLVGRGPVYVLNPDAGSFRELKDLILKSLPVEKDQMTDRINKLGKIKLAVISGIFINKENVDPLVADLLIVGDYIERRKLLSFLKSIEAEVGKEIKFSVMDKEEFQYRWEMFDRFIRVLLDGPHEKLINKLGI